MATTYTLDHRACTIERKGSIGPDRVAMLSREAAEHLAYLRSYIPGSSPRALAAWQDVLAVYFAHWEE